MLTINNFQAAFRALRRPRPVRARYWFDLSSLKFRIPVQPKAQRLCFRPHFVLPGSGWSLCAGSAYWNLRLKMLESKTELTLPVPLCIKNHEPINRRLSVRWRLAEKIKIWRYGLTDDLYQNTLPLSCSFLHDDLRSQRNHGRPDIRPSYACSSRSRIADADSIGNPEAIAGQHPGDTRRSSPGEVEDVGRNAAGDVLQYRLDSARPDQHAAAAARNC